MMLSRQDLIKEILTHAWHAPILRALAAGPKRYAEIRAELINCRGYSPGDGYISAELRELRSLEFVEQRPVPGRRRPVWTLTGLGTAAVGIIDEIEYPTATRQATSPDDGRVDTLSSSTATPTATVEANTGPARRRGLSMDELQARAHKIDTSVAHPARRYNYWLGGKDNFAADRISGDLIEASYPSVRIGARENRALLKRAVRFLAGEAGIDQFLDIGTGLPTADNTHEVAQSLRPESRVVYVDNDPMVMTHARALLTSTPQGRSRYLEEDLRNPERILGHPEVRGMLDFDRPIALILVAVLHFIEAQEEARGIVRRLLQALPSGSYLAASSFTLDHSSPEEQAAYQDLNAKGKADAYPRSLDEFTDFFTGLQLVPPGIVPAADWRSPLSIDERPTPQQVAVYGGVGRKP